MGAPFTVTVDAEQVTVRVSRRLDPDAARELAVAVLAARADVLDRQRERIRASRSDPPPGVQDFRRVLEAVAAVAGVQVRDLVSPTNPGLKDVVTLRQIAMWVCVNDLGGRLRDVGLAFGRDHSTVAYSCAAVEARMAQDLGLTFGIIERVREKLTVTT